MIWQAVNKVEMEINKELREIVLDNEDNSKSGFIELGKCLCHWLANDQVVLQESEEMHDDVFVLKPLLNCRTFLLDMKLLLSTACSRLCHSLLARSFWLVKTSSCHSSLACSCSLRHNWLVR